MNESTTPLILLTGATGYVGGRLLTALRSRGHRVRCFARNPDRLRERMGDAAEIVGGDVLEPETLAPAMAGVHTAYYLIHSMGAAGGFEQRDRIAAENFAAAARDAGVGRIVYLGGLGDPDDDLSPHLRSRQEVGRILRDSGVETLELRASIVIGSGSLSFEMIRALTERLPVMVTPRWVSIPAQPIAVTDLIDYLVAAGDLPGQGSRVFEIGGADVVSYRQIMREYARQRGLRRLMVPVPLLSPRLSSLWLSLVTPVYARIGRKLIDSIRHETVVRDDAAARAFDIRPRGIGEAIADALGNEDAEFAVTRWSDALSSSADRDRSWAGVRFGSRIVDSRAVRVVASPEQAFAPIRRIGGDVGWYYGDFLWQLRGLMDAMIGGVGMRRGRRDPEQLVPGDTLDFWRVEAFERPRDSADGVGRLRLSAEMLVPGRAWLQFEVYPSGDGASTSSGPASEIRQTAIFDPIGLSGLAYWHLLYPIHQFIFRGMLRNIARAVRASSESNEPGAMKSHE
jgi:uncharacterized protein YbjT (DUF2867 family)